MTYFAYLALFLGIPLLILSIWTIVDYRRGHWQPKALNSWRAWTVMLALSVVAFIYTTPWDNYLVATRVWWYDPELVTGLIIGWVPIEEYTFFILLPILSGLWLLLMMRTMPVPVQRVESALIRRRAVLIVGFVWVLSVIALVLSFASPTFKPLTYLGLELSWALIPVLIQLAFGADILWRHRRMIAVTIVSSTIYYSLTDAVAIAAGTWTIDPAQSLQWYLGGVLPIEEFIFFLLVNILVVMGMTLVLAEESQERAAALERIGFLRPLLQRMRHQNPDIESVA